MERQTIELIQTIAPDEKESDEEKQEKRSAATEFSEYAALVGADAMALLMEDRKSTTFVSTSPDAAFQNRQDMLQALRNLFPSLRGSPPSTHKGTSRGKRPKQR